jgi:hypothetical protein
MDSVQGTRALPRVGFPIRKSSDQSSLSSSPRLIAAFRVLHRLLVPRHPPCALVLLYIDEITIYMPLCSFQGARGLPPESPKSPSNLEDDDGAPERLSLKTEQHETYEFSGSKAGQTRSTIF